MRDPANAHWRDSARPAKLFMISAYSALPFIIFLLHIRLWTFILAATTTLFFAILEKFGLSIPAFLRWLKVLLAGKHKPAKSWWN